VLWNPIFIGVVDLDNGSVANSADRIAYKVAFDMPQGRLEHETGTKLELTSDGIAHKKLSAAEGCVIQIRVDAIKIRMVQEVDRFGANLQPGVFGQTEVLRQRGIQSVEPWSPEGVPSEISINWTIAAGIHEQLVRSNNAVRLIACRDCRRTGFLASRAAADRVIVREDSVRRVESRVDRSKARSSEVGMIICKTIEIVIAANVFGIAVGVKGVALLGRPAGEYLKGVAGVALVERRQLPTAECLADKTLLVAHERNLISEVELECVGVVKAASRMLTLAVSIAHKIVRVALRAVARFTCEQIRIVIHQFRPGIAELKLQPGTKALLKFGDQ
jgi:hypothetical protein